MVGRGSLKQQQHASCSGLAASEQAAGERETRVSQGALAKSPIEKPRRHELQGSSRLAQQRGTNSAEWAGAQGVLFAAQKARIEILRANNGSQAGWLGARLRVRGALIWIIGLVWWRLQGYDFDGGCHFVKP